ncbi:MAG: hypothetical protein ABEK59_09025 [Halobacteria archaeon]
MDDELFYNRLLPFFLFLAFIPVTVAGGMEMSYSGLNLGTALQTGGGLGVLISSVYWFYRPAYPVSDE